MKTCSKKSGALLVELGMTKDSYFVWTELTGQWNADERWWVCKSMGVKRLNPRGTNAVPAYTACELMDILRTVPNHLLNQAFAEVHNKHCMNTFARILDYMEADDLCAVLIWLLENGHITAEEINGQ